MIDKGLGAYHSRRGFLRLYVKIVCVRRDVTRTIHHQDERRFADGDGVGAETAVDDGEHLCYGIGSKGIFISII